MGTEESQAATGALSLCSPASERDWVAGRRRSTEEHQGAEMAGWVSQGSVTFEELAVSFNSEEWALLADWQKELYKDVMRDNYEMLNSLELAAHKPELILRIEQGEEPCVGRLRSLEAREGPNHTFTGDHIRIKKESCLKENSVGQPCHPMDPEALKRTLNNGDACGFSQWMGGQFSTRFCMDGTTLQPPWPTEHRWLNCSVVGQQPVSVAFQVEALRVSGDNFGPVGISVSHSGSPDEMLLICTQCQKCFSAPLAHHLSSMATTGQVAQVCSECEPRKVKVMPSTGAQQHPAVASLCPCTHCLAAPNLRQRIPKEERPYKCGKCDKSFCFAHEHTWHQKVHAGEKIYRCHQCKKVFRHRQELMWHQRTHTPEWPHKCSACEKSFRFKQELTWHLKTHVVERPYKCPECEKSFRFKQEFMWHQRGHVGDRPYKCPECEKSFRFKQEFTWHQRSHASEKTYKCSGCDKSFRYKQEFVWHQRIHTGEQPYPCASCSSTFTCRQEYVRHQRLHDGEKPYQCPHCDKTFRRGSTLIRHRRIHTGEVAFKCSQCDRCFGQSAHLLKHQRMHAAVKHEPAEKRTGWPPCLQNPELSVQPEAVNVLSLNAVSVGALLVLNLQEPKQEKDLEGQMQAWEPQM